jgi:hypothetical protein
MSVNSCVSQVLSDTMSPAAVQHKLSAILQVQGIASWKRNVAGR